MRTNIRKTMQAAKLNLAVQQASGTKGSDVYTSSGSALVDLNTLLVRNADEAKIKDLLLTVLASGATADEDDAFVLAFQTRDVRGGRGERDLFQKMLLVLNEQRPVLLRGVLELVAEYGCWRDLVSLSEKDSGLVSEIATLMLAQLEKDEASMTTGKPASLLAKWLPREDKHGGRALLKELRTRMTPGAKDVGASFKAYRQRVSKLNKYLQTTEIKMCAGDWEEIEPAKVPGRCLGKHVKAFLNEKAGTKKDEHMEPGQLRHPDDPIRMKCRENFQTHFAKAVKGEAKVNGAQTRYPHELVKKLYSDALRYERPDYNYGVYNPEDEYPQHSLSREERDSLIAVWNSMIAKAKESGGLGRTIAMCDFSGSMQSSGSNGDTPYWVSMAMGLFISELTSDEFKDTFMTFDSNPVWHTLPAGSNIVERVENIKSNPAIGQGTSTDFQKAMDLVLATLKQKRVRPGEEPKDLIVVTDMNWDQACSSSQTGFWTGNSYRHNVKTAPWQTHIQMIRESFKRAGEDMWGEGQGWAPPRIVIWNVAATSADFHAMADTEGVIMLGGWSPSLFKTLCEEGARVMTPFDMVRVILDAERYQPVRDRLAELRPKKLSSNVANPTREMLEVTRDRLRLDED